jgi:hypothetical protein
MFGMSPLDVMEQRIQQQTQENASRRAAQSAAGQSLGIFNPLYQAGLGFSDMAGQAARSLFGTQDPMLMKAAQIQQAMAGRDMNKPEDMIAFSQELAKMGYTAEAMQVAQQARTAGLEERRLTTTEEDIKLRREAAERKVSSEQTTTKGIRVFRRGDGPLIVEEGGQDVPYDEKKHGRFETAQDRTAPKGVTIKDITNRVGQVIGREFIDPITGNTIRKSYFEGMGPTAPTAPGAGGAGKDKTEKPPLTSFEPGTESTTETSPAGPVRSGRGRPVSNRVPTRPPEFILRGTNRIKNKAYDDWTAQYGATHNPDGTPK